MADISLGNNYEINKAAMLREPVLNSEELAAAKEKLTQFIRNKIDDKEKYFMLLCHEKRSYTIFNLVNKNKYDECVNELIECAESYGIIIAIDKAIDSNAYEIWIKTSSPKITNEGIELEEDASCYYFFPYTSAVIEVK